MDKKFSSKRPLTDKEEAEIQAMIAADPDDSDATDKDIANARPFTDVFPDLAASIRASRGRPKLVHVKELVSLRIDKDVLEKYRAKGKGWQTHMNKALRKAVGL